MVTLQVNGLVISVSPAAVALRAQHGELGGDLAQAGSRFDMAGAPRRCAASLARKTEPEDPRIRPSGA